jgi:hypothetical protein
MNADEVIQRLCKLHDEVWRQISDGTDPADCFCGKGGFWGSTSYGGTFEQGYRNSGKALEFIEQAVREKLRPTQETSSARPEHVAAHDCACAECVAAEVRCTCKDFPGADEFCTAHSTPNRRVNDGN